MPSPPGPKSTWLAERRGPSTAWRDRELRLDLRVRRRGRVAPLHADHCTSWARRQARSQRGLQPPRDQRRQWTDAPWPSRLPEISGYRRQRSARQQFLSCKARHALFGKPFTNALERQVLTKLFDCAGPAPVSRLRSHTRRGLRLQPWWRWRPRPRSRPGGCRRAWFRESSAQ
jgi:hypothetical protein